MKLDQNKIDELNLQLSLNITPEDYSEQVKKKLNEYRRKAEFKGFRKGNVPMGMIQKVYGEQALGDTINDVISEALAKHIQENNLKVLGEPILSEDQPQNEWKLGNEFNYKFDLGLSPEINVDVTAEDKLTYYKIDVKKAEKEEMKKNVLQQYGDLQETEKAGENDYLVVDFAQPAVENGYSVESVQVSVAIVAEPYKSSLVGVKAGEKLQVNVTEAFTNETDRAAMLKVKKDQLADMDPNFEMTVVNVKTFVAAEESQETYDKIFGEGVVNSADEFDAKIAEQLAANYKQEADYRLSKDIKDMLLAKANLSLPENFLKRWLYVINQGKFSKEQIEKEFDSFLADFKWQMVRGNQMQKLGLKVEAEDLKEAAAAFVAYQYASYGISVSQLPESMIQEAAQRVLGDERQANMIHEQVEDQKVIETLKKTVTLEDKKISHDKFAALA